MTAGKNPSSAQLRIAMLGMVAGNGHPYSWSAIVNGFDPVAMADCPYPGITQYLNAAQRAGPVGLAAAAVTHVWTDDPREAPRVAAASRIPHVLKRPEDAIGQVDAVMIATDDGYTHVQRARPFVEAGLPIFVDKPLALTTEDLRTFRDWERKGARILSSSGLRYAAELDRWTKDASALGELRWLSGITCNAWENYGIHALEPIYRITGPGFVSVRLEGPPHLEVAQLMHRSGVQATIAVLKDDGDVFGTFQFSGTRGQASFQFSDTYTAFRRQMVEFVAFARGGARPYPFEQTIELMSVIIAGIRSRAEGARRVEVAEVVP